MEAKARTTDAEDAVQERDLAAGRAVLTAEAEALGALAAGLDARFASALDILEAATAETGAGSGPGRVIVSGMGKSGHVGRKIAATLASTGTPAQFVHPGEASHGDLGMITERDAVIAISNSGETWELTDLIQHVKRFRIPLVAITSRAESTLARAADVALVLPDRPEAGAIGLAPTTSTTMTLALGDALSVALLERKGFTAGDFRVLHPGGKLGRQLAKVADFMHCGDELPLVGTGARMDEAVLTITSKHFGCVGIVDGGGTLCGIITDGDLRRNMARDLTEQAAADVMTRNPVTVTPEMLAAEALNMMNTRKITAVFVVADGGKPAGIVHIHDFLRAGVA
jgi:arabinose-5-phosphate isomerase